MPSRRFRHWHALAGTCLLTAAMSASGAPRIQPRSASATDPRETKAAIVQQLSDRTAPTGVTKQPGERPKRVLRTIYFHPGDQPPLPAFRERVGRILLDVQAFYREGMRAYGVDWELPLEMADGQPVIHVVQGRRPSAEYDYTSGGAILAEIRDALGADIRFRREHLLIFHGLCDETDDGTYRVHAPYYGSASPTNQSGICHVADVPELDPQHFTNTTDRIRYREHTGTFDQTLAGFNTKYIGGVAHELGHALGLPHVSEAGSEGRDCGTALMGSGNHTYRQELWDAQRRGSFLTVASAVRLVLHPLQRQQPPSETEHEFQIDSLAFSADGRTLRVTGTATGTATGTRNPVAVIGHVDPDGRSDYDSDAGVSLVSDGTFSLQFQCWKPGLHTLKLDVYHEDGAHRARFLPFTTDGQSRPDATALMAAWMLRRAEEALLDGDSTGARERVNRALALDGFSDNIRAGLEHLALLAAGQLKPPAAVADVEGPVVHLSDAIWESASVGWGQPARNRYYYDQNLRDAVLLKLGDRYLTRGLYAHAPSRYVYRLGGRFTRFNVTVGLQAGAAHVATGVFVLRGDGRELCRTEVLKPGQNEDLDVDITDVDLLELVVESGKDGNACCWTVWGDPTVRRAP